MKIPNMRSLFFRGVKGDPDMLPQHSVNPLKKGPVAVGPMRNTEGREHNQPTQAEDIKPRVD